MAQNKPETKSSQFWERMRNRFIQSPGEAASPDDAPRSRGFAITVCILISCVLWFTFTMSEEYVVRVRMPTRVINLVDDQALTELPDSSVSATVRGEGIQLLRLYWDPPAVVINAAERRVNLSDAIRRDLPKNVVLEGADPSELTLEKEPRVTRKVPVRLRAQIDTPPTHELLAPPDVEPDSVLISGARSVVNDIDYWPTQLFRKTDLKDSLSTRVPLADTLRGLVGHFPDAVQVRAAARQFTTDTREINVTVTGIPPNEELVVLEPSSVRVNYRVLLSQFNEAKQAPDFYAEVSYEDIISDTTGRVKPILHTPADLEIRDIVMMPSSLQYYWRVGE